MQLRCAPYCALQFCFTSSGQLKPEEQFAAIEAVFADDQRRYASCVMCKERGVRVVRCAGVAILLKG